MYDWQWSIIWQYKGVFLEGAAVTLWTSLLSILIGTAGGTALALLARLDSPGLNRTVAVWISLCRALPVLVVLIWIYYVVPISFGLRLSSFAAAVVALSLHLSGFVAETLRAALRSVPAAQWESGLAVGMTPGQTLLFVIAPQAVRNAIPNLLGLYITEIKNSSLASVIAVNEVLHRANIVISETFRPLEIYTGVALTYLIIILPLIALAKYLERQSGSHLSHAFSD